MSVSLWWGKKLEIVVPVREELETLVERPNPLSRAVRPQVVAPVGAWCEAGDS